LVFRIAVQRIRRDKTFGECFHALGEKHKGSEPASQSAKADQF